MFDYVLNIPEFSCKQSLDWWGTDIPNACEKSKYNQSFTEWYTCGGKCGATDKNAECLCCDKLETVEYFELLVMRYGDVNAVTQRVKSCLWNSSFLKVADCSPATLLKRIHDYHKS